MTNRLMMEFEEFEGLEDDTKNIEILDDKDEDDGSLKPAAASSLSSGDVLYELDKRGIKSTGFPDTDKELLQKAFDEEFKNDLEEMKAKRREKKRKAAKQAGLQRRRLLMEKTLQEEQDELARNHQISMMIELVKENMANTALRIEVNSVSARSLSKAMWANDTITCLDLSSNDLNDHAGSYLARILRRNSTLKKIELDNNRLGQKTCLAFGESLLTNTSLVYLSLDSNPLCVDGDHHGFKVLSDSLRVNSTLTSLNLWRTGINSVAGSILAAGLDMNDTILFCDVGHNDLDAKDLKLVIDKLDANLDNFEKKERQKRANDAVESERQKKLQDILDEEEKQRNLAQWLTDRRDGRAESRRLAEELRMAKMFEELEEKKRLEAVRLAEEKKAEEEAAAKKAKKKGKGKK